MPKILILIGLSGSGKSTFAKKYCAENPYWLRVNRDDIRKSLLKMTLADYWKAETNFKKQTESQVNHIQKTSLESALNSHWNVILDNTHLDLTHINEMLDFLKKFKVEIRFLFLDISLEECIARDAKRIDKIGEQGIRSQYEKLQILKQNFDFEAIINSI